MTAQSQPQLPLYNSICFGKDAYVNRSVMIDCKRFAQRWWKFGGRMCSLQLKGGGLVKPLDSFGDHAATEEQFLTLMEECYQQGIYRPSSYAAFFAKRYRSPRIKWTYNSFFAHHFAGGWEQARQTGYLDGNYKRYDIRSAYLWAASEGLPDPTTFTVCKNPIRSDAYGFSKPGLYVVDLAGPTVDAPYPFNGGSRRHIATTEEIEFYNLPVERYHIGVTWDRLVSGSEIVDLIQSLPAWKQVARSFWGRWCAGAKLHCHTQGKQWTLGNPFCNQLWAHMIVSRVKMKIYYNAVGSAHVFVDSIITEETLPLGNAIGDWQLEKHYPEGLFVLGAGIYGTDKDKLEKNTGGSRG